MVYHNISLSDAAKKMCTVTTALVKYEYNSLPMGVCIVSDIFQEQMSALMDNLESSRIYPENLLIISSGTFE